MSNKIECHVFLHGVPDGHDWCGTDNKNDLYVDNLYGGISKDMSAYMIVEMCNNYSYYTLVRSKGYTDFTGRSGSFFGITMRVKQHCYLVQSDIYNVFSDIYNTLILNNIISPNKSGGQYLVRSFQSNPDIIKKVCKKIDDALNINYFIPVQVGKKLHEQPNIVRCSIEDADKVSLCQQIQRGAKILISEELPSLDQRIQESVGYIKTVNESLKMQQDENKSLQELYNEQKESITKLQKSYDDNVKILEDKIKSLDAELAKKQSELDLYADNVKLLNEFKHIISAYNRAKTNDVAVGETKNISNPPGKDMWSRLNIKLVLVIGFIIIILVSYLTTQCSNQEPQSNVSGKSAMTSKEGYGIRDINMSKGND
ncbi:MAG: hypothetical protein IJD53_01790 [Alistipes sp.]|nr:hypothetical protein [Alistipes sp.]